MKIQFYNSLSHRLEEFQPLTPGIVRMYGCGPTVYDYAHIGNFRTFLFTDMLRRFLELAGFDVRHVMNITDVGHMTDDANADGAGQDRMEAAAVRLREDKKSGKGRLKIRTIPIKSPSSTPTHFWKTQGRWLIKSRLSTRSTCPKRPIMFPA
jgi:cysteinyl-tRNA synthetase